MKDIVDLHQSGRLDEAAIAYRELLSREPGNVDALRLFGVLQRQRGDLAEATRLLETARTVAPQRGDVLLELAGIRFIERDMEATRQLAGDALKFDPNLSGAHTLLGQMALMDGDFGSAESHYRTALRADEQDTNALTGLGHTFLERNDATSALRYLMRAAELNPSEGLIQFALGRAFRMQNNLAFAEQALGNALRLRPELHAARLWIGQLLTEQGRAAEAESHYAVLNDAPAWKRAALAGLGDCARSQGRFAVAVERYRDSLALEPNQPMVLQALAWCHLQQGDADTALALYTEHLAQNPGDRTILAALAELQLNLGRAETAQELWTELLTRYPDDALAATRLALLCERNGEFADALAYVGTAEKTFPKDPELAFVRIRTALREGDYAGAIALLEKLREANISDGQARLAAHYRGLTHDHADELPQAVAYWCDSQRDIPASIHAQDPLPADLQVHTGALPAAPAGSEPAPIFLLGLPGSEVERVAGLLMEQPGLRVLRDRAMAPLRADDFTQPNFAAYLAGLSSEEASERRAHYVAERARLGERDDAREVDWLLRWDARFIPLLRAAFPDATVVVVERDPRDLLLTWLAFGWMPGFPLHDPSAGADWLARAQAHFDALNQSGLNVVRVNADALLNDPVGAGAELAKAAGLERLVPGMPQLGLGGLQLGLPAGRWIAYADTLGPAFSRLMPFFG
jgi:tetratricopeptide (TPR) repeat protein